MDEYLGSKEVVLSDDEINTLFQTNRIDTFGCIQNQYLLAKDSNDNIIKIFRCDKNVMHDVPYKTINSRFLGKVKPRNPQQQMAIDMLCNKDITIKVITGPFGSGKDVLMCSTAIDLIERGEFEKVVYVRNNIEVEDSKPIGFLPGTYNEKLLPFAMPLCDHCGGVDGLNLMISNGQVEVIHLGFIRGRDIRNSIILSTEAENMTKEHIQLLIGRVGEGSALWINGDFKQCDSKVFRQNSGLMTVVDKLKGHPRFGYVKLLKVERSETAAMAALLD